VLLSAGWDNTIQMWDLRTEGSVRSIFGPHICGDSVDISGNDVVSGSWRPSEQLQLWDYRSGELIANVPWQQTSEPCLLYAAQFSKSGKYIAAGGSGSNEVRLFSRSTLEPIGGVTLAKGVYGIDFSADSTALAIAAGDFSARVVAVGG
jgi:WD40 repeat protein